MKLLIAVDMEGISGVVHWEQVTPGDPEYQRFRHIMTADVNAAVQGAAEAGADDIQVTDGHWNGTNILIEELDARARLNSGSPSPFSMVEGIDSGVEAAFFIGYHARSGATNGILNHTWSDARIANVWLNGRLTGETGLNGSVCGAFQVPVLMISGDQTVADEAREWIAGIDTVVVKQASGMMAANCLPPQTAQQTIRETAGQAIQKFLHGGAPAPIKTSKPVTIGIEFNYVDMAERAMLLPGAKRLDGKKIEFQTSDMVSAYFNFRAAVTLARR
ncbi:MAG: M55 family metallopeptidase [Anaerolineaceae bacterium]|nr:M55 family metallopeptidase [Anaerolineaceae bacterium]